MSPTYSRREIVELDVTSTASGSEAGAAHGLLAIVLQADRFRYGKTILVVPLTTNFGHPPSPFGVAIAADALNHLRADSLAMCWQVWSIDRSRITAPGLGRVQSVTLDTISKNVALLCGYPT